MENRQDPCPRLGVYLPDLYYCERPVLCFVFKYTYRGVSEDLQFLGGVLPCCFQALLGLGTHAIHGSLRVFGLCSFSEYIIYMSLVGFAAR